jgi:hypothetical protein
VAWRHLLTVGWLGGLVVASGCAGPVHIAEPEVDDRTRRICTDLVAELPRTVLDNPRRETTGVLSAAWGSPPITLTCGIPQPAAMTSDTRCFEVNGVGWYAEEGEGGWLFTTIGRTVHVQLGVPTEYAPEADALVEVAAAINRHDPVHSPCL